MKGWGQRQGYHSLKNLTEGDRGVLSTQNDRFFHYPLVIAFFPKVQKRRSSSPLALYEGTSQNEPKWTFLLILFSILIGVQSF
jgi:hypothetical protein